MKTRWQREKLLQNIFHVFFSSFLLPLLDLSKFHQSSIIPELSDSSSPEERLLKVARWRQREKEKEAKRVTIYLWKGGNVVPQIWSISVNRCASPVNHHPHSPRSYTRIPFVLSEQPCVRRILEICQKEWKRERERHTSHGRNLIVRDLGLPFSLKL